MKEGKLFGVALILGILTLFFVKQIPIFLIYFVSILFIYNGIYNTFTIKKTRKNNLTDALSLCMGIVLILITILAKTRTEKIFKIIEIFLFCFSMLFVSFCINSIIGNLKTKKKDYNVIIILGAGLVDGIRPSRTLKNRLNKALEIYQKSSKSKIIVSGGKGENEKISEAEAMKRYLVENAIPEENIIMEDKSTNTMENLKFSKEKLKNIDYEPNIALVTSDFHIYRAKLYAKSLNIDVDGIGSKTMWYYVPNMYIREFSAIIVKYKYAMLIYTILAVIIYTIIL